MATKTETTIVVQNAWGGTDPVAIRIWYGRHVAPQSGTRHRGWWFAADGNEISGPFSSFAEAEEYARETCE